MIAIPEQSIVHTPGPWKAERFDIHATDDDDRDPNRWSVLTNYGNGKDYVVATVENGAPGDTMHTEEANAKAIAAIPEMIEFLNEVAMPPYSDSDLASLLETLRCRAGAILALVKVV